MEKRILLGSIIAVVILILVSLNPVVGMSFENSTDIQQSSNTSEINNDPQRYYPILCSVFGEVKNVRWVYNDFWGHYILELRAVNVRVSGLFQGSPDSYYTTLILTADQRYDMNHIKYFGLNFLKIRSSPSTVKFLFGLILGGTITNF